MNIKIRNLILYRYVSAQIFNYKKVAKVFVRVPVLKCNLLLALKHYVTSLASVAQQQRWRNSPGSSVNNGGRSARAAPFWGRANYFLVKIHIFYQI